MYTFLFTDVEGSTQLWEQHSAAMSAALTQHDSILSMIIEQYRGRVFKTVGDAFYAMFESATHALKAAVRIQQELHTAEMPVRLRVRMALHTGEAEMRGEDYFGATLNQLSRLIAAAHGGQILISASTERDMDLPDEYTLRDLGLHRLRSLSEPIQIYQVVVPGLPLVSTPIKSLTPHPTNLPNPLTSFIGRDGEVRAVSSMLRQRPLRLLTLTGMGGIGKTRLSLQVGRSLLDDFHDGVFFVDLSLLYTPADLLSSIAEVLNIREVENFVAEIKAYLRERRILLILDNFEQIVDAAPTVSDLLMGAPGLTVLVTSREPLNLYGEQLYHVRPLNIPNVDLPSGMDKLMAYPAVALFVERIRSVQLDFTLTERNAGDVKAICQYLEGLPLALELAAVRIRDNTLSELRMQLKSSLEMLKSSFRDLSSRQRTMRGAIQWSYDLLTEDERRTFVSLGVFVGAFTQEAAQVVSGATDFSSFVHKNLLQRGDDHSLTMLAVLREFALEKQVEQQQYDILHQRCADFFLQQIETAESHLVGPQQVEWFNRLRFAYPNIRASLTWLLAAGQVEKAARMMAVLWRYWAVQSTLTEGLSWLDSVLARPYRLPALLRAKILHGAGRLAMFRAEYARARNLLDIALEFFRAEGYPVGQAMVLSSMGENELQLGNLIRGEQLFGESLILYQESGHILETARPLDNLGNIAVYLGNLGVAADFLQESLSLERQRGSIEGMARILNNLAEMMRVQEKYDEAMTYYEESLSIYRKLGSSIGVTVVLHNLGQIALIRKDFSRAAERFQEALSLNRDLEERRFIAECLAGLGSAWLYTRNPVCAVRMFSAAENLLTELRTQLDPVDLSTYQRNKEAASAQLDRETWKSAWAEGAAMPLAQVIEISLA